MPTKTQEVREFFKLTVSLPTALLGEVMADLVKRGITEISHELITEAVTFKNNKQHEVSGADLLEAWTAEHPTFTSRQASAFFKESGRTNAGLYYAINILVEKGALKKLGDKNYARSDVKAIEGPKKKSGKGSNSATRYEVSNETFIIKFAKKHHGRFSTKQLKEAFEEEDRNSGSVSPACNELLTQKLIKRIGKPGSGEYVLTAKGGGKPPVVKAKPKKAAPKKSNGNGSHIVETPAAAQEVVTNG